MVSQIVLANPNNIPPQKLYDQELDRLKDPTALERRLTEMTKRRPFRRIYVMGCGRSGTWVLTHVMSTLKDTDVVLRELAFEYFGLLATRSAALVLKRDHLAYQRIEQIPECIEIAYIVRHPFDVLTSHLPGSGRPFHILPQRWLGEMTALRYVQNTGRKQTKVIRYEDMVTDPVKVQSDLGEFFGLSRALSMDDFYTSSSNASEGPMHRSRKLDPNSINKHKHDPEKVKYLKEIKPGLGEMLEWVGDVYRYDISL
jgi:hypothetical protein